MPTMNRRRSSLNIHARHVSLDMFFPPGTQRIESPSDADFTLSPVPSPDPEQPLNWSRSRKSVHIAILSWYTIISYAAQTSATPLWVNIEKDTGVSIDTLTIAYASNSAALGVGCILFIPLAMKFGRRPVYMTAALLIMAAMFWQARAQTAAGFIGSNLLCGLAGAVIEALFQVTVDDVFFVHQRASANGLYLACMSIGTYLGPVAAGYVAMVQTWRWMFYYLAMSMALSFLTILFALEESKFTTSVVIGQAVGSPEPPTEGDPLLPKGNDGKVKEGVNKAIADQLPAIEPSTTAESKPRQSSKTQPPVYTPSSYWHRHRFFTLDPYTTSESNNFFLHIYQPFQILVTFPAVGFAALQYGYLLTVLSIVAVTQATFYPEAPYHFDPMKVGLMSVPPAIGAVIGSIFGGPVVDKFTLYVAKRRDGIHDPEARLWLFAIPSIGGVVGLLLYGLTLSEGLPWAITAVGAGLTGFTVGACGDMALTYVQDSYEHILGDALVGVAFVRNFIATLMVFVVPSMMDVIGSYNMFIVFGVFAALATMSCLPMLIWGRRWRCKYAEKYWWYAERQY